MADNINEASENPVWGEKDTAATAEEASSKARARRVADEIVSKHKLEEAEQEKLYKSLELMFQHYKGTEEQIAKRSIAVLKNYELKKLQSLSIASRNEEIKRQKQVHENRNAEIEQERAEELASLNLIYKDKRKRDAEERKLRKKYAQEDRQRALDYADLIDKQTQALREARGEQTKLLKERNDGLKDKIKGSDEKGVKGTAKKAGATALAGMDTLMKSMSSFMDYDKKKEQYTAAKENQDAAFEALEKAKAAGASDKELEKLRQTFVDATKEANASAAEAMMSKAANLIADEYKQVYETATNILSDYKGAMDARLQGSDKTFNKLENMVSRNLTLSPFVKTTAVLEKLKEATERGIVYNLEQRAYLATLQEKLVSTFDAFDASLLRIIRLQQADSTVARMGMEAVLTKFLNSTFEDSSYLSDVYDTVSSAILDANSQLTNEMAAEFEYIVQKWMGSLYSVGMSSETINTIAQGLNYIATGDVTSLANNSQMQTLFAMAASNANLEYSELLLNGLDADKTNKLLEGMFGYLKKIAEDSENQVVKSAYGEVLNLSLSDMTAISNLSESDIKSIANNTLSYSRMNSETSMQMLSLVTRTSLASMLDNLYQNVLYGVAEDMAGNPITFGMNKMLEFMDTTGVDINIPFINAMGFGLDLNTSVKGLMKMGLGIAQAMSLAGNLLGALGSGSWGGLSLDAWGASETTKRGSGMSLSAGTMLGETSGSVGQFATSGNSSDTSESAISSATDDSEDTKEITNKNSEPPEKSVEDVWNLLSPTVGTDAGSFVVTQNKVFLDAYEVSRNALRVFDVMSTYNDLGHMLVYDKTLETTVKTGFGTLETLVALTGGVGSLMVSDTALSQTTEESLAGINETLETTVVNKLDEILLEVKQLWATDSEGVKVLVNNSPTVKLEETSTEQHIVDAMKHEDVKSVMETAMRNALGQSEGAAGGLTIKSISDPVKVVNDTGDKLQVSNLVW